MTTIYLIRHSKPLKPNNSYTKDSLQIQNEKCILSVEGEEIASETFNNDIFNDIDCVYTSNYVRAISTAKYVALNNNLEINVVDDLGERKFGISSWNELPDNFGRKQFLDENYKIGNGESLKEVRERMYSALMKILNNNKGKNVVIVSHGTAISCLLKKWCDIEIHDDKLRYMFNGKELLTGYFNYCETFRLTFDDDKSLINIKNVKYN